MSDTNFYIFIIAISALLAGIFEMMLLPRLIYIAKKKRLFDIPDVRKRHTIPIPRLGGMSFIPIIISITFLSLFIRSKCDLLDSNFLIVLPEVLLFVCGLFLIYLLGAKDDLVGVNFKYKFVAQTVASLFIICSGLYIRSFGGLFGIYEISSYIGIPLSVLFIVYTTNAINLIDGADGLASGLSAIAFFFYGLLFIAGGLWTYATIAFIVFGLLIPFFYYNFFHPSRKIFMGDTGSLTLGYLLSFMMLKLFNTSLADIGSFWPDTQGASILIVFSALYVPLYDAVRVMFVRIITKRSPFSPDRNHIHHKLIDLGLSRRKAVFSIVIFGISFLLFTYVLSLFLDCTIVCIIHIAVSFFIAWGLIWLTKEKKITLMESQENTN